ncbi:junctional adhesion molecule-like isoform X2 [Petaurus breviceps papuanus]|uniref:junctional adhesion molecule-like isoform X2 n=1 Tax=Petaurus breviceps papuanus TaxID=3040969 RepID=UPI0036DBFEA2
MFYPLELKLICTLLGSVWGLADMVLSSPELMAHVGGSALLDCVLPSAGKKQVTKVHWMFSAGEQERAEDVREADQGVYTCEIQVHKENSIYKKTTMLRVVPAKPTTLKPTELFRTDVLSNYQHVIIVGIVCFTVIMIAVLGVTMRRSQHHHRSENHLENISNAKSEEQAHIYSTIAAQSVIEEEESSRASEATYMTMQPVWPSWRAEQKKSSEIMPETEQTLERPRLAIRPPTKEHHISQ